ncbi:MAG TPA: alpha/beta fold hydrolase [Pirellulales bacterium]|jgi:pimeloyl-ACP methyl ester carboxylesterase|nr:alpha/beta fold hydrolase [Pirellulales bacterium]
MVVKKRIARRFSLVGCVALVFGFCSGPSARADEFIDLTIPLVDGRYFSPRDFCAESNHKLHTHYPLDRIADRKIELTTLERAALILAGETGLLRVTIGDDKLVIGVPNREDDRVRHRRRRRLEKLLHVPVTEWPEGKGLHLPNGFDQERRSILLVHGLEAASDDLQPFARACHHADIQAILFDYPNDGPIAWSGDRLRSELDDLAEAHPRLKLAIVAHSMGGLAARYALESTDSPPKCVTHLFMLGTPNHGTALAGAQEWIELVRAVPARTLFSGENLCDGLGEAAVDLRPDSEFLKKLNDRKRPAGVRYYSAIGRQSFLAEKTRAAIERELADFFRRRKTPEEIGKVLLDALASDEMRDGKGDGAVAIASARLEHADGERVFDLNHKQLLALPTERPEDAQPFRWVRETLGWPAPQE